jgi:hypothetical protein
LPASAVLRRVLGLVGTVTPIGDPPTVNSIGSGHHLSPQESGKLAGDGHHRDAGDMLAALQLPEAAAQPQLRRPRAGQGVGADVLLALVEGAADEGAVVIGPGRLHQLEAQMLAAGAGDVTAPDVISRGALAGHQPSEGHERGRVREPPPVADLGGQRQRTQLADAPVGGQPRHRVGERRLGGGLGQVGSMAVTWASRLVTTAR